MPPAAHDAPQATALTGKAQRTLAAKQHRENKRAEVLNEKRAGGSLPKIVAFMAMSDAAVEAAESFVRGFVACAPPFGLLAPSLPILSCAWF